MYRHLIRIVVITLLSLVSSGCATSISRESLLKKMQEKPLPLIVDVRSKGEYDSDHMPGAVHIPFYSIGSGLKERGVSRQETIVIYCEHGPRAGLAALLLYFSGYENYYSPEGHMQAWRAGGMPLEKGSR